MEKLKPCPFCGEIPTGNPWQSNDHKNKAAVWYFIRCRKCDIPGPASMDEEMAYIKWNCRTADKVAK
jgi:Lar family restriction alleviation protein